MPRAHRYYMSGYIWHLTHRCHRKQFLLRYKRDRLAWVSWLYEARRRYGLCVLDYNVTSNHVHLILFDVVTPRRDWRLLHDSDGGAEARASLSRIYATFEEGRDLPDLRAAAELTH